MTLSVDSYSFSFWPFSQLSPSRKREKRKKYLKKKKVYARSETTNYFFVQILLLLGRRDFLYSSLRWVLLETKCHLLSRFFFLSSMSYPHKRQSAYGALSAYLKCEVFLQKKSMNPKRPLTTMHLFCCSR